MGSSGTGRFSDYSKKKSDDKTDRNGGSSGEDKCGKAFSVRLEDIETSPYWKSHSTPPLKGTTLLLQANKRIEAITKDGQIVGNLPTSFNYLKYCIEEGFVYQGIVTSSSKRPISSVAADFAPTK